MKTKLFAAAVAAALIGLTGCANMDRQNAGTVGGAVVGGVVGDALIGVWDERFRRRPVGRERRGRIDDGRGERARRRDPKHGLRALTRRIGGECWRCCANEWGATD